MNTSSNETVPLMKYKAFYSAAEALDGLGGFHHRSELLPFLSCTGSLQRHELAGALVAADVEGEG